MTQKEIVAIKKEKLRLKKEVEILIKTNAIFTKSELRLTLLNFIHLTYFMNSLNCIKRCYPFFISNYTVLLNFIFIL